MSTLSDITAGIKTALEAANPKLRCYTEPPPSPIDYSKGAALVLEPTFLVEYDIAMGGDDIRVTIPATLRFYSASEAEGWQELQKYLSPVGTESIRRGINTDPTLGAKADTAWVASQVEVTRNRDNNDSFWEFSSQFQIVVTT